MTAAHRDRAHDEPLPRLLLVVIALIFLVLGGLAALIANDVRDEPTDPTPPTITVSVATANTLPSASG